MEPLPKESSDEDDDFVRNQVSVNFADDDKDSKAFEESALKGANDALYAGPMAGYPVTRARVEIQQIEPHNACNPAIVRFSIREYHNQQLKSLRYRYVRVLPWEQQLLC